jgi:uracil-DNA glycosylase
MIEWTFPGEEELHERFLTPILKGASGLDERLLISCCCCGLATYFAPLDYFNPNARVVLVGLTPGRTQMLLSIRYFREYVAAGGDLTSALKAAKYQASFGGQMRRNLVAMLDSVSLNQFLGIPTCNDLFATRSDLAHHTSVLRYPVFFNKGNYGGRPQLWITPFLQAQVSAWFQRELVRLQDAVVVPLGRTVQQVLLNLVSGGAIRRRQLLCGFPHPSGANSERIAYFLRKKDAAHLSSRTNATSLDSAHAALINQIQSLQ